MFREKMKEDLTKIFKFKKTTFDAYSAEFEQETLFIEVHDTHERMMEGKATARVVGELVYFSQVDKMKYGQVIKSIERAENIDKKKFFFYDIDKQNTSSQARLINIAERRISFVYLYEDQYDPDQGKITSLECEENFS